MKLRIDGQRALVTGASSGLGLELARLLAPRVQALVLVARRQDRLLAIASELGASHPSLQLFVEPCDLSDSAAVDALAERVEKRLGGIDLLLNNAGLSNHALFDEQDPVRIEQLIRTNVLAPTLLTRRLLPGMVARDRGGVLNVGSRAGLASLFTTSAVYGATKHYISGFSESLRLDLAGTHVTVTQACPGPIETEFLANAGTVESNPPLLTLSARQCAVQILGAFERGKALVEPGFMARWLMGLPLWLPKALRRPLFTALARRANGPRRRAARPLGQSTASGEPGRLGARGTPSAAAAEPVAETIRSEAVAARRRTTT